jgi:hypothetical protein
VVSAVAGDAVAAEATSGGDVVLCGWWLRLAA